MSTSFVLLSTECQSCHKLQMCTADEGPKGPPKTCLDVHRHVVTSILCIVNSIVGLTLLHWPTLEAVVDSFVVYFLSRASTWARSVLHILSEGSCLRKPPKCTAAFFWQKAHIHAPVRGVAYVDLRLSGYAKLGSSSRGCHGCILCYCLAPGVSTGASSSSTQVVRGRAFEEILLLTLAD